MAQQGYPSNSNRDVSQPNVVIFGEQDRTGTPVQEDREFEKLYAARREALGINSFQAFESYWEKTLGDQRTFNSQHEHGAKLWTQRLDNFGASAYDIIQKLNPLIDIVKGSGIPVDVAIGVITFCFAVAKNRQKMESRVSDTLLAIQDRLPGMKMYEYIYNSAGTNLDMQISLAQQLRSKLVDAYDSFVQFCIAAIEFYTTSGFMRRLKALGGSPRLETRTLRVQNSVIAVKSVCEELLSMNIDNIKRLNEGLEREIKSLTEKIQGLENSQDRDNLVKVRKALNTTSWPEETQMRQLAQHRDNITAEFRHSYRSLLTPEQRLNQVKEHPTFVSWEASSTSRILILAGVNDVIQAAHCWLSPVALGFILELSRVIPRDPLAFYVLGTREEEDTFQQVLSFIILRLLELNRETLREQGKCDEFFAALDIYAEVAGEPIVGDRSHVRSMQDRLVKVASATLSMFDPSKTVWIVLDRLDQCRFTEEPPSNFHRKALLKALVKLVEDDGIKTKLRILIVVNAWDWQVEVDELDMDRTKGDRLILKTFRQNERH